VRADLFFFGAVHYCVADSDAPRLFALLQTEHFAPRALHRSFARREIRFFLPYKHAERFERAARESVLAFRRKEKGVRAFVERLLHAPGLIVGILLGVLLLLGARCVVWDVRVTGTQALNEAQILRSLEEIGVFRGAFLLGIDPDLAALSLRQSEPRVGYAAINVKGTVVHVQIRENEPVPAPIPKKPANLVAARDGIVTVPLIFEGTCLVKAGEVVRAGQILAGGLVDTQNHGCRVTRAAGQVLARTEYEYTVRVPFLCEEKVYTGEKKYDLSLFFFHRTQKVFKNIDQNAKECDIIEEINWFRTPAGAILPLGYCLRACETYEARSRTRTVREAREAARAELERLLCADAAGRTLLSQKCEWCVDGEGITLICTVVCEEDIARTQEFVMQP
jgi:similar to stage IV sporulation protein